MATAVSSWAHEKSVDAVKADLDRFEAMLADSADLWGWYAAGFFGG